MPNRYIREGIIESKRVNSLTWQAEVFYRRLMNRVDDFGRFTANHDLLRASLFPLQLHKVQTADIGKMLLECVQSDLVSIWKGEDGGEYLAMHKWEKGRALKSKYPNPPTSVNIGKHLLTDVPDPGTVPVSGSVPDGERAREPVKPRVQAKPAPAAPHGTGVNGVRTISLEKELRRVEERMRTIRDSYDGHQSWTRGDLDEHKTLKARKRELKDALGFKV